MLPTQDAFEFDYCGQDIVYGRGQIGTLESYLGEQGLDSALVVCGSNVGANTELMEPLRAGLGDRLAGVFDETTPEKLIETVYDGIDAVGETDADVLVGVGGGSSLDVARQISAFEADGRPLGAFREMARDESLESPDPGDSPLPVVVVPTTFAGADISSAGSMRLLPAAESPTGQTVTVGGSVEPIGMFYDPNLFGTTPMGAIAGSAMNGFNKGLERIYSNHSTPITDATARRGVRMLQTGLPKLPNDPKGMERAVIGIVLVQFERRLSVIHAFAHGYTRRYPVQQGEIHGILAPHVLRYVFDGVDGRRTVVAEALGIDPEPLSGTEVVDAIVEEVGAVRDALDLPTRLRDLEPLDDDDFRPTAEYIMDDAMLPQGPDGLDPTVEDVEAVLRNAW